MKRLGDIIKEHFFNEDKKSEGSIQKIANRTDIVPKLSEEEKSRQYQRDRDWLDSHYNDLFHQYQGKFIAVSNEQVIASERDGEKMMDVVERMDLGRMGRKVIIMYFDPV